MKPAITIHYKAVKFNKCDTQYQTTDDVSNHWITERVKIEAFQGFSNAYNLGEYFRLRGETSWKSGEQVTGLWKSDNRKSHYHYGDRRSKSGKTLILFYRSADNVDLKVCVFPDGFYPTEAKRNQLILENA